MFLKGLDNLKIIQNQHDRKYLINIECIWESYEHHSTWAIRGVWPKGVLQKVLKYGKKVRRTFFSKPWVIGARLLFWVGKPNIILSSHHNRILSSNLSRYHGFLCFMRKNINKPSKSPCAHPMHRHNRHSTVKTATGCFTCSLLTLWYSGGFGCAWGVHHRRNRHNRHNRHSAIIHHKLEHTWIYVHIAGTHLRLRQHLFFERQVSMRISDRPMEHTLRFSRA